MSPGFGLTGLFLFGEVPLVKLPPTFTVIVLTLAPWMAQQIEPINFGFPRSQGK
jgi:hypothetical protein